ncbi:MAG TPA: hypothetical protein VE842_07860 [Pyrinomonadaceae bacterium]|nr:hypothetical protein [Pyrinomonadaceae bacterium]
MRRIEIVEAEAPNDTAIRWVFSILVGAGLFLAGVAVGLSFGPGTIKGLLLAIPFVAAALGIPFLMVRRRFKRR